MSSIVDFDCATGRATLRDMTAEETDAHQRLKAAVQQIHQARQADDASRTAVLVQVAQKLGMSTDDLTAALRIEPVVKPGKS